CYYVSRRRIDTFSDHSLPVNAFGSYIVCGDRTLLAEVLRDLGQHASSSGGPSVGETSTFKAKPPAGTDPIGASSEGASLYQLIREDIIEGRLAANERLVAPDLAQPARRH